MSLVIQQVNNVWKLVGENNMYDVVIIGAGVSGSACARELSKYNLSICVVEKEEDVCCGTSKANSAIVHSGIDCKIGTLMAQMNLRGNEMMDELSKKLDFEFRRNGSLIVCFSDDDMPRLKELYNQGIANGVPDLKFLMQAKRVRWSQSCLMKLWQLFTARQEALYVRLA